MKTLPEGLVYDLRNWFAEVETFVDDAASESDSRQFPSSIVFSNLQSILHKHWPSETQLSRELKKLKVNNREVNRKPKEK